MTDSKTAKKIEQGEPTETRPPQDELAELPPYCERHRRVHLNGCIDCAEEISAHSGSPARAAAPVEPPKCGKCTGHCRCNFVDSDGTYFCEPCNQRHVYCAQCQCCIKFIPPATELVEPAPRPQEGNDASSPVK